MAAIGALTAGVAHEVRNPLFGISSTLDAFEARFGGDGQYQRYLHVLRGEVDRLVSLMGALLDYGKPPVQETAPVKIDEVIGGALRATEPLAKSRGVNLDEQCLAPGMTIRADAQRLCQVFQNLLENAIHHSSVDDSVIIRYEACDLDDRLWAQCRIIDSGPGFRAEDLPHVFEPFFTRRKGGTGLGLSIVQRIVDEHGGIITAANGPGGGAVMTIKLPVVDDGTSMHNAEGTPFGDP
jgi:signal transduction histidine kinase